MDMDMDMSGTTNSTTMSMSVIFFTSYTTPLYSSAWTPKTISQYAGTCIFLIVLAVTLRFLMAFKQLQESRWLDAEFNRRFVAVAGKQPKSEIIAEDSDMKRMVLSENGAEEDVMVVRRKTSTVRPWRFTVDPARAALDTVIAGVGYLLMLAVMTVNAGYFLSVLGGSFLGSMAVGRFIADGGH